MIDFYPYYFGITNIMMYYDQQHINNPAKIDEVSERETGYVRDATGCGYVRDIPI
jgi:hypothetical protein